MPGGVIGFDVGMGQALNGKASLSAGCGQHALAQTEQSGRTAPGSARMWPVRMPMSF